MSLSREFTWLSCAAAQQNKQPDRQVFLRMLQSKSNHLLTNTRVLFHPQFVRFKKVKLLLFNF